MNQTGQALNHNPIGNGRGVVFRGFHQGNVAYQEKAKAADAVKLPIRRTIDNRLRERFIAHLFSVSESSSTGIEK